MLSPSASGFGCGGAALETREADTLQAAGGKLRFKALRWQKPSADNRSSRRGPLDSRPLSVHHGVYVGVAKVSVLTGATPTQLVPFTLK